MLGTGEHVVYTEYQNTLRGDAAKVGFAQTPA